MNIQKLSILLKELLHSILSRKFSKKIIFKASKVDFLRWFPLEMCNFCHKYDGRIFVGYYSQIRVGYEYVFDYKMSDTNTIRSITTANAKYIQVNMYLLFMKAGQLLNALH